MCTSARADGHHREALLLQLIGLVELLDFGPHPGQVELAGCRVPGLLGVAHFGRLPVREQVALAQQVAPLQLVGGQAQLLGRLGQGRLYHEHALRPAEAPEGCVGR
jgi:hypothetical protein